MVAISGLVCFKIKWLAKLNYLRIYSVTTMSLGYIECVQCKILYTFGQTTERYPFQTVDFVHIWRRAKWFKISDFNIKSRPSE